MLRRARKRVTAALALAAGWEEFEIGQVQAGFQEILHAQEFRIVGAVEVADGDDAAELGMQHIGLEMGLGEQGGEAVRGHGSAVLTLPGLAAQGQETGRGRRLDHGAELIFLDGQRVRLRASEDVVGHVRVQIPQTGHVQLVPVRWAFRPGRWDCGRRKAAQEGIDVNAFGPFDLEALRIAHLIGEVSRATRFGSGIFSLRMSSRARRACFSSA